MRWKKQKANRKMTEHKTELNKGDPITVRLKGNKRIREAVYLGCNEFVVSVRTIKSLILIPWHRINSLVHDVAVPFTGAGFIFDDGEPTEEDTAQADNTKSIGCANCNEQGQLIDMELGSPTQGKLIDCPMCQDEWVRRD